MAQEQIGIWRMIYSTNLIQIFPETPKLNFQYVIEATWHPNNKLKNNDNSEDKIARHAPSEFDTPWQEVLYVN